MRIVVVQRDIRDPSRTLEVPGGAVTFMRDAPVPEGAAAIGPIAVLEGDACMDPSELERVARDAPAALVLHPQSESDLQAEAALELALALSESVASLVLVVEDDGAEPGRPAHGGSAIVFAGEVLAEAMEGADVLQADVETPISPPHARRLPVGVPTILQQRLAHHQGRHLEVDYPADV